MKAVDGESLANISADVKGAGVALGPVVGAVVGSGVGEGVGVEVAAGVDVGVGGVTGVGVPPLPRTPD